MPRGSPAPPSPPNHFCERPQNQSFNNVMAALASNTERWGFFNVDLELERREPAPPAEAAEAPAAAAGESSSSGGSTSG